VEIFCRHVIHLVSAHHLVAVRYLDAVLSLFVNLPDWKCRNVKFVASGF